MIEFLKAWKARLLAVLGSLVAVLELLQPKWLVQIFGPGSEGWVNVVLVIGIFVIHQLLNNTTANQVSESA